MELPKLNTGKFVKRYKRFFADIKYKGEVITAHTPNTGSMKGCLIDNADCLFSTNNDPKRKLKHTLFAIKDTDSWIGVHTGMPNKLVYELWENKTYKPWKKYKFAKPEVKISKETRFDLCFWNNEELNGKKTFTQEDFDNNTLHFIEVKNVTMREGKKALFPDAVTTRGQKHIRELIELKKKGHTVELVFVIQRTDITSFSPAKEIDPTYAELLSQAKEEGVIITPLMFEVSKDKIEMVKKVPLKL